MSTFRRYLRAQRADPQTLRIKGKMCWACERLLALGAKCPCNGNGRRRGWVCPSCKGNGLLYFAGSEVPCEEAYCECQIGEAVRLRDKWAAEQPWYSIYGDPTFRPCRHGVSPSWRCRHGCLPGKVKIK